MTGEGLGLEGWDGHWAGRDWTHSGTGGDAVMRGGWAGLLLLPGVLATLHQPYGPALPGHGPDPATAADLLDQSADDQLRTPMVVRSGPIPFLPILLPVSR